MSKQILKSSDIAAMTGTTKTHFLNTNAVRIAKSLGDMTGMKGLGFHLVEIEPGRESTEYHLHHYEDECVYILCGDGTVTLAGEDYLVSAGDFIGYPSGGEAHTMKNTGEVNLVCLVAGQRLDHDIADYPNLEKRLYRNKGNSELVDHHNISAISVAKK
ncbi:cupin domain-containing protein [Gammaproteobacteria bacterium AS21]